MSANKSVGTGLVNWQLKSTEQNAARPKVLNIKCMCMSFC